MSSEAERVLAEAIQKNLKGDVIYFWAHLGMDGGVTGSSNAFTFWSMCDILNGDNCRYVNMDYNVIHPSCVLCFLLAAK